MELFVYTDETIFEIEVDKQPIEYIGAATLICTNPILDDWVSDAMSKLKADPDILDQKTTDIDTRTITNNFFHASMDSKNAHSHLCRSIVKNLNGNFQYSVFERKNGVGWFGLKSEELLVRLVSSLSSVQLLNETQKVEKVVWVIEGRDSFTQYSVDGWIEEWYDYYDSFFPFALTAIPVYYPNIEIYVKGKNDPGLQILDFLIWATNRKYGLVKDSTWFDRLKLQVIREQFDESGIINSAQFYLGREIDFKEEKFYP
ncbi:MAG: DUF3800 domain-containing protein, partial [Algicola sp.]|nr:DUF3800 domain-containing protein [Algicola sp.]